LQAAVDVLSKSCLRLNGRLLLVNLVTERTISKQGHLLGIADERFLFYGSKQRRIVNVAEAKKCRRITPTDAACRWRLLGWIEWVKREDMPVVPNQVPQDASSLERVRSDDPPTPLRCVRMKAGLPFQERLAMQVC
jgi:hypothetical protein